MCFMQQQNALVDLQEVDDVSSTSTVLPYTTPPSMTLLMMTGGGGGGGWEQRRWRGVSPPPFTSCPPPPHPLLPAVLPPGILTQLSPPLFLYILPHSLLSLEPEASFRFSFIPVEVKLNMFNLTCLCWATHMWIARVCLCLKERSGGVRWWWKDAKSQRLCPQTAFSFCAHDLKFKPLIVARLQKPSSSEYFQLFTAVILQKDSKRISKANRLFFFFSFWLVGERKVKVMNAGGRKYIKGLWTRAFDRPTLNPVSHSHLLHKGWSWVVKAAFFQAYPTEMSVIHLTL